MPSACTNNGIRRGVAESGKVLVDTSAWLDLFAGTEPAASTVPPLMKARRVLICGMVLQEVLQ